MKSSMERVANRDRIIRKEQVPNWQKRSEVKVVARNGDKAPEEEWV